MALVLAVTLPWLIVEPRMRSCNPTDSAAVSLLQTLHPHAAGIDVGSREMWVCVPRGSAPVAEDGHPAALPPNVRRFGTFTPDLRALAEFLAQAKVTTVVMESTGVYWIPLYDLLQTRGFDVVLADPRQVRRAPGRPKTDVLDCQWLQRLHSLGLCVAAFRPEEPIRVWRAYQRHRANLVRDGARHLLRVQKALEQMNVKLTEVVADVTGATGMGIIKAILAGERDPARLAKLRDPRCKHDEVTIAKALEGTWRAEHLFELGQSLQAYEFHHTQMAECDQRIEEQLRGMALPEPPEPLAPKRRLRKRKDNEPTYDARRRLYEVAGVDLTAIEGIEATTALVVLSEVGTDMSRWPSAKQFGSWLGLAPCPRKSGGKVLSAASRPGGNRAAAALRLAARSLRTSQSALGAFYRRVASRRGAPKAITAAAYKLARIIYGMLKHGREYAALGLEAYEQAHQERAIRGLRRKAAQLGLDVVERAGEANG
jgi:transposase